MSKKHVLIVKLFFKLTGQTIRITLILCLLHVKKINKTYYNLLFLSGHRYPICDLASSGNQMVSSDEQGNIIIWSLSGSSFKQTHSINGSG